MTRSDDNLGELLQLAGLQGLDAMGRRRFRQAVAMRRKVRPFTGSHAGLLNGLDEFSSLEALAGLSDAELAGIGKKLRKVVKKAGKVVAKVSTVIPAAALMAPSKAALKNAAKGLAIGGAGAAAITGGGAIAEQVMSAAASSMQKPEAPTAVSYDGGGSGGGDGGRVYEGEYIPAGQPDPTPADDQWIAGIDNKWVLLSGAGLLTALLAVMVTKRRNRMRYSRYAA